MVHGGTRQHSSQTHNILNPATFCAGFNETPNIGFLDRPGPESAASGFSPLLSLPGKLRFTTWEVHWADLAPQRPEVLHVRFDPNSDEVPPQGDEPSRATPLLSVEFCPSAPTPASMQSALSATPSPPASARPRTPSA